MCYAFQIWSRFILVVLHCVVFFIMQMIFGQILKDEEQYGCLEVITTFGITLIAVFPTIVTICEFFQRNNHGNCTPLMHILVMCMHLVIVTALWTLVFVQDKYNICFPILFRQSFFVSTIVCLSVWIPFFHFAFSVQAVMTFVKLDWNRDHHLV